LACLADPRKLIIGFVRRGYSPSGGAENYLKRLARAVVELGHEAQLFATKDWPNSEWPFGPLTVIEATSAIGFADELEKMRPQISCDVLMSLERVWRCDVYRAGDGVHRAWLAHRSKFELPLQRFVRGLNPKHSDILRLEEALFAKGGAEGIIANSEMVKREIVDFYRCPAEKIDVVRNGIPMEQFLLDPPLRETSRAALKLKPDDIALLFAGSGWERKGLRFAIEAMELCRNPKMVLLVAGRGNERLYKTKRLRFLREEPIRFLGEVNDPQSIYAASDIFILPSIYDPFSNACLEALAFGLPVITTKSNGFSEIIDDGVHGSVVDPPNNVFALRDAIQFWSNESRRAAVRSTITERASHFDISKNVDQTLAILVRAAARPVS
jgi:UDP-glucose:(heptosyl)LPS alpha-1,3-glucosyltransferase